MVWWFLLSTLTFAQAPAPAPGPVINRVEDIWPLLPPPGTKTWNPQPVVDAVNASPHVFTPKDYYACVDHAVPADITKAVAARAAVFYDPSALPLTTLAANARRGQPAQTIPVGASDFTVLFEFFNDVQNDLTEAESHAPPDTPQAPSESQSMYERRMRARDEALVQARGPFEGRIEATTFQVDLPASVVDKDGCKRSYAVVDMSVIPIDLFRVGMGTRATTAIVDTRSSATVETARFTVENPRRFEVVGRCGTTGTKAHLTMKRTYDGKWSAQGGF